MFREPSLGSTDEEKITPQFDIISEDNKKDSKNKPIQFILLKTQKPTENNKSRNLQHLLSEISGM